MPKAEYDQLYKRFNPTQFDAETPYVVHYNLNVQQDLGRDFVLRSPEKRSRIKKSWALLFEKSIVIVCFDNDKAGRESGRPTVQGKSSERA